MNILNETVKEGNHLSDRMKLGKKHKIIRRSSNIIADSSKHQFESRYTESSKSASTTAKTTHIFKFQGEICGDFVLDLSTDNSAVWDNGVFTGYNAIEEVQIRCAGEIMRYSGTALFLYMQQVLKSDEDKLRLKKQTGLGGDSNATHFLIPLLAPGSNCVTLSQPIDTRAIKSGFEIRIELRPGNVISKTNALVIDAVKLRYKAWVFNDEDRKLLKQCYTPCIDDYHEYDLVSTGSEKSIRIDQNLTEKEILSTSIIQVTVTNRDTEFEYLQGTEATSMKVTLSNKEVYEHQNSQHALYQNNLHFGTDNVISQTSDSYYYNIPYVSDFKSKNIYDSYGGNGVKLEREVPILYSTLASGTYKVFVLNVGHGFFVVKDNGHAEMVY